MKIVTNTIIPNKPNDFDEELQLVVLSHPLKDIPIKKRNKINTTSGMNVSIKIELLPKVVIPFEVI